MWDRITAVATVSVVWAMAGCHPYRDSVDRELNRRVTGAILQAPAAFIPLPWKVGQWVVYRTSEHVYSKYEIVRVSSCGIWLRHTLETYKHRLLEDVCFRHVPDLATSSAAEMLDLEEIIIVRHDDDTPVSMDLRHGRGAQLKETLKKVAASVGIIGWGGVDSTPPEIVDTGALRFLGARKLRRPYPRDGELEVWLHPAVPITGIVKSARKGMVQAEVVDFSRDM